MTGLSKRELTSKALRIDVRVAKDLEALSSYTGYSQNDIIVMAIKKYLFENRKYFVTEIIQDRCIARLERDIIVMREEAHIFFGLLAIDLEKTDSPEIYAASLCIRNKFDEIIFEDHRELHVMTDEWETYKNYIMENSLKYINFNDEDLKRYFYDRFSYE